MYIYWITIINSVLLNSNIFPKLPAEALSFNYDMQKPRFLLAEYRSPVIYVEAIDGGFGCMTHRRRIDDR